MINTGNLRIKNIILNLKQTSLEHENLSET